eukprot:1149076-Pelagomonas_calceolata.AAC.6
MVASTFNTQSNKRVSMWYDSDLAGLTMAVNALAAAVMHPCYNFVQIHLPDRRSSVWYSLHLHRSETHCVRLEPRFVTVNECAVVFVPRACCACAHMHRASWTRAMHLYNAAPGISPFTHCGCLSICVQRGQGLCTCGALHRTQCHRAWGGLVLGLLHHHEPLCRSGAAVLECAHREAGGVVEWLECTNGEARGVVDLLAYVLGYGSAALECTDREAGGVVELVA